jgi:hypothetical protein
LQAGYKILHPYYGAQAGGALRNVVGVGPLFEVGGAVVGHITGRAEIRRLDRIIAEAETTTTQQARLHAAKSQPATTRSPATASETDSQIIKTSAENSANSSHADR